MHRNVIDKDTLLAKIGRSHSGPMSGRGNNGRGKPFLGIVEDTPQCWVTWLTDAARTAGLDPAHIRAQFYNTPLEIEPVEVGFGTRYYFRCPHCNRRCEAVFYVPRTVGCRKCLHLGYRSQVHRSTSKWYWLDMIFDRKLMFGSHRYEPDDKTAYGIAAGLRERFEAQLAALADSIKLDVEE